jgi:hypothetical protein
MMFMWQYPLRGPTVYTRNTRLERINESIERKIKLIIFRIGLETDSWFPVPE